MSSSSSDSDSDEFEPIRRIKINIRPKGSELGAKAADVSEIKASVEAWRPLGPPPHSSLSRRQSSLSSVSSMSFGAGGSSSANSNTSTQMGGSSQQANATSTNGAGFFGGTIYSSPSCSSLVNEFNNRSSFSNFMSTISRTSSPLTLVHHGDVVPIAIAIQESIELIVKGHYDPSAIEPKFNSRILGNIKIAFSNAFAKGIYGLAQPALKLRMLSTDKIIRYYASRLIKDLDLSLAEARGYNSMLPNELKPTSSSNKPSSINKQESIFLDFMETQPQSPDIQTNSKLIEFDMEALMNTLRRMHDQTPTSKYYNVDVVRYQVSPINSIEESPLQVCAYWKVEPKVVRLRIDFKHSSKSGLNLERLREVTFTVNLSNFIPCNIDVNSLSPDSVSTLRLNNNNNNNLAAMNMNDMNTNKEPRELSPRSQTSISNNWGQYGNLLDELFQEQPQADKTPVTIPPPAPLIPAPRYSLSRKSNRIVDAFGTTKFESSTSDILSNETLSTKVAENNAFKGSHQHSSPNITYEPKAHWNSITKQLTWKFDTLLSYHKSDGLGSLFAKIDFRNNHSVPLQSFENQKPSPVDVKFLVTDSTLSKVNINVDSNGYKMSLLKKEIRSGRYRSEPYLM